MRILSLVASLLLCSIAAVAPLPACAQTGTIVDLGTFPDRSNTQPLPLHINSAGTVAGILFDGTPFAWTPGNGLTYLENLRSRSGRVAALTEANVVIGDGQNDLTGKHDSFLSLVGGATTFLGIDSAHTDQNGVTTFIGSGNLSGNNAGVLLGTLSTSSDDPSCPIQCSRFFCSHVCPTVYELFRFENGQVVPYPGTRGGRAIGVVALNDSGTAILTGPTDDIPEVRGTFAADFMDAAPTGVRYVAALNNLGELVGFTDQDTRFSAVFRDAAGHLTDLLDTDLLSEIVQLTLSNKSIVVGSYRQDGGVRQSTFIWSRARGYRDLNQYLPPESGWTLLTADAINDQSWISGTGIIDGQRRAYVLRLPAVDPDGAQIVASPHSARLARNVSLQGACGPVYIVKHHRRRKKSGVLGCTADVHVTGFRNIDIPQRLVTLVKHVRDKKGRVTAVRAEAQATTDANGHALFALEVKDKSFLLFGSVVDTTDNPPYGRQSGTIQGKR